MGLIKNSIAIILLLLVTVQFLLFVSEKVEAFVIKVGVMEILDNEITSFFANTSTDLVKFNVEVRNKGSIAYAARVRIDFLNSSSVYESDKAQEIFTAWSSEKDLMPGDRKNYELYWYHNESGNFVVRARIYYGNEILEKIYDVEKKEFDIDIFTKTAYEKESFKIDEFRVYDKFIIFDLYAKKDAEDIIIIPAGFTKGWIFEQKKINSIKGGRTTTIVLPYEASFFSQDNMTIEIVSDKSKLYTQKSFTLTKDEGLKKVIFSLIDRLKLALAKR